MYKKISLVLLTCVSYANLSSLSTPDIPIDIPPACSVEVKIAGGLESLTGFETNQDNYGTITVCLDTTGNIQMTTELDLANSKLVDDLNDTGATALNIEPILWSLKPHAVRIETGANDGSVYNAETDQIVKIPANATLAPTEVNNTDASQSDYYDHRVRMLYGIILTDELEYISYANAVESSADMEANPTPDLDDLKISETGDGDGVGAIQEKVGGGGADADDPYDKWTDGVQNLSIQETINKNSLIEFDYKFGYHFPMGATGTNADKLLKIVLKTTVLDLAE